jgi:hemerythrin superfamily protein
MVERHDELPYPIEAIAMLQADHRKVKELFAAYERARDVVTKQQMAAQVFAVLDLHAQVEENVFYPAFEGRTGKKGIQLVADSRLEHEKVKEFMAELQRLDVEREEFQAKFHDLMHTVQHHVDEEEQEMFPEAEQILADQLEDLRDQMVDLKQQLTTSTKL